MLMEIVLEAYCSLKPLNASREALSRVCLGAAYALPS